MGRFGRFGADYSPGIGKRVRASSHSFSIQAQGYSFNFETNWSDWATFTKEKKMNLANAMMDEISRIARLIGIEAIKRCPHYSGALEHSIKSSISEMSSLLAGGRAYAVVGVRDSWQSSYDEAIEKMNIAYPTSSPELIRYIHEYYDSFIAEPNSKGEDKAGYKRKLRKEAVTGETVGSHFLTRPFYESDVGKFDAQGIIQKVRAKLYARGAKDETAQVNDALSQEARKYDSLDED